MHHSCYKCRTLDSHLLLSCDRWALFFFFFVDGILVIVVWLKINLLVSDWESRKTINKKTDKAGLWGSSKHQETSTPKSPPPPPPNWFGDSRGKLCDWIPWCERDPESSRAVDLWPPCGRFEQGLKWAHYITFLCSVNSQENKLALNSYFST